MGNYIFPFSNQKIYSNNFNKNIKIKKAIKKNKTSIKQNLQNQDHQVVFLDENYSININIVKKKIKENLNTGNIMENIIFSLELLLYLSVRSQSKTTKKFINDQKTIIDSIILNRRNPNFHKTKVKRDYYDVESLYKQIYGTSLLKSKIDKSDYNQIMTYGKKIYYLGKK